MADFVDEELEMFESEIEKVNKNNFNLLTEESDNSDKKLEKTINKYMTLKADKSTSSIDLETAFKAIKPCELENRKKNNMVKKEMEKIKKKAKITVRDQLISNRKKELKLKRNNEKIARDKLKLEQKKQREAERIANQMPIENGVRKPRPNTKIHDVWKICDNYEKELRNDSPVRLIFEDTDKLNLERSTVKTQISRWRKYNNALSYRSKNYIKP